MTPGSWVIVILIVVAALVFLASEARVSAPEPQPERVSPCGGG